MKKWIILSIAILFTSLRINAQKTIIDVQTEFMASLLKFQNNTVDFDQSRDGTNNFSLSISTKLYRNLYFRTSIGNNNLTDLHTQINWNDVSYTGSFSLKQQYLEFLPEFRLRKGLVQGFICIGFGAAIINEAEFDDIKVVSGSNPNIPWNMPRFNGVLSYFTSSLGLNMFITDRFGIKGLLQYRNSGYTENIGNLPRIGFNQFGYVLGISYQFLDNARTEILN